MREARHAAGRALRSSPGGRNYEAYWLELSSPGGSRLRVISDGERPLHFSANYCTDSLLTHAQRQYELEPGPQLLLNIDGYLAGLGSATCGPGTKEKDRIKGDGSYFFSFALSRDSDGAALPALAARLRTWSGWVESQMDTALAAPAPLRATHVDVSLPPSPPTPSPTPPCRRRDAALALTDERRGVAGHYAEDWMGWSGTDSLLITLHLATRSTLRSVSLGSCMAAGDWVLPPEAVEVQWSRRGKRFSPWQPLTTATAAAPEGKERKRTVWRKDWRKGEARRVQHLRLRVKAAAVLPAGHASAGQPAWLMIDEIEVRAE